MSSIGEPRLGGRSGLGERLSGLGDILSGLFDRLSRLSGLSARSTGLGACDRGFGNSSTCPVDFSGLGDRISVPAKPSARGWPTCCHFPNNCGFGPGSLILVSFAIREELPAETVAELSLAWLAAGPAATGCSKSKPPKSAGSWSFWLCPAWPLPRLRSPAFINGFSLALSIACSFAFLIASTYSCLSASPFGFASGLTSGSCDIHHIT
mmetsp:Transcript_87079/g.154051  ORF Transcript_87079/g.154051 Transcript_87079/m.154051 type:complete len:209 (+) Transcript_87079:2040-2666(+)